MIHRTEADAAEDEEEEEEDPGALLSLLRGFAVPAAFGFGFGFGFVVVVDDVDAATDATCFLPFRASPTLPLLLRALLPAEAVDSVVFLRIADGDPTTPSVSVSIISPPTPPPPPPPPFFFFVGEGLPSQQPIMRIEMEQHARPNHKGRQCHVCACACVRQRAREEGSRQGKVSQQT